MFTEFPVENGINGATTAALRTILHEFTHTGAFYTIAPPNLMRRVPWLEHSKG